MATEKEKTANFSEEILEAIKKQGDSLIGITGSPSTTLDIVIDIAEQSKAQRALGQMVYVVVNEDGQNVLVIGQIIGIETQNRWHEDPSFKGVIKRHGRLPHLSGTADNRVATISVQACYNLGTETPEGHILGTSPSTGERVQKMNNEVMSALMKKHDGITYMGKVYGTDVDLPFWFKHFDRTDEKNKEIGAGDAYHIGVFGRTGSGKTVSAAYMLLGYAKNKNNISIMVLDPQRQFFADKDLLPPDQKLEDHITQAGMKYEKYEVLKDICLPSDNYELLGDLLANNGFLELAFRPLYTPDKIEAARDAVIEYLRGRANVPSFNLNSITDKTALLQELLNRFTTPTGPQETSAGYSSYVVSIFGTPQTRTRLQNRLEHVRDHLAAETNVVRKWENALELFTKTRADSTQKMSVEELVKKVVLENGNFIVLDISGTQVGEIQNENLQAVFIKTIEAKIVELGAQLYADGKKANCLIVMDEAHRFISTTSQDPRIKELTQEIIGSVRTTRKYGIGYMFITQTIESLDDEILRQMRIFAFGYGLTSGSELRKVSEFVNNPSAIQLYKSFIDPSSNRKFPFMFFGPVSPLSFTGSPLFIEMYGDVKDFK